MAINYTTLAAVAQKLIDGGGRDLTIQMKSRTPADSNKPWRGSTGNTSSITVKGVVFPFSFADVSDTGDKLTFSRELIHDLVRRGDSQCIIAANETESLPVEDFDTLLDGTDLWKIIQADPLKPGDTVICYTLHLRK